MGFGDFFKRKSSSKQLKLLSPEQEALLNQLIGVSKEYAPQVSGYLSGVLGGKIGITPEAIEKYYQEGVLAPALAQFETYVRPMIEEQFGGKYHTSARTKALSRAFNDLMTNMAQTRAQLGYQGMLQNLQSQMQAASMMQGQMFQPLGVKTKDFVVTQQPSPFDNIVQGLVGAGAFLGGVGSVIK